jgi:myxalamid-type nonribosomal peptide synthetase MxaA
MSVTHDAPEQLAEARRALLEKRRRGRAGGASAEEAVQRRPSDGPAPASFGQERLWFVQHLQPASSAYHMTSAVRLRGPLDTPALHEAIQRVADRHEALRTTLALQEGALVQRIAPALDIALNETTVPPVLVETTIREIAREPFDLEHGPLVRAALLHESSDSAVLVVVMHHIISDEWSMGVFWREVATAYGALTAGEQPELPPLPLQYADVAWHQRQQLARGAYDAQLAYWSAQLQGELPLLQLPADRQRPPVQRYEGGLVSRALPAELAGRIADVGRAASATPFAVLLAAFQVLLYRLSHQTDILVGTPVTSRDHAQTEGLIGFFLNTAVMRADFSKPAGFDALLAETRRQSVAALANQMLPFERLVEHLRPRRDPSHNPIFQAMFVYQDASAYAPQLPGLASVPLMVDAGVSKFDLTLFAALDGERPTISLEYSTALFEQPTAERLLRSFEVLLQSIAEDPATPVDRLAILAPEERRVLLQEWSATNAAPIPEQCIHDLIAAQPAGHTAVVYGDETLSYGELDARANQLAHHLIALGAQPGDAIGLCVERSLDMAVGILGILKAGCGYVPIDPAYPRERVRFMVEDAGITILLTQPHVRASLPEQAQLALLSDPAIARQPRTAPPPRATPDDLAYMIYTSGSTGQPKGVRVAHRNLVHSTTARFAYYPEPASSFLLLSSFAFDSSLVGIFWTLCQGGTLCLPPQHAERDVLQLASLIERVGATHTLMLPSLYRVLLDFAEPAQLRSLRTVIVAGEPCPLALAAHHHALLPDAALYNEYGPTEGTVWATAWRIPAAPQRILIGRAIPNMQTYILDARREPVPIGVAGELYIGGAGVTAGYHNRPDLTEERFVPNPFGAGRLYRTGDLARYLADGEIEFLGRVDTQVKLNCYRLELGEIEAALLRHPAVGEAVVLLVEEARAPSAATDVEGLAQLLAAHPDAVQLLAEIEGLPEAAAESLARQVGGD